MSTTHIIRPYGGLLAVLVFASLTVSFAFTSDPTSFVARVDVGRGEVELEMQSGYSRIKVRKVDHTRALIFVRDSGEEVVETIVDLDRPHELLVDYTRYMFLSYLFRPDQERVLIVGLGGGSMIHFLKRYDPRAKVDVVEIDPAIVKIADEYFGVRKDRNLNVIVYDVFNYLKRTPVKYDSIYIDAFLKPANNTDATGVPLRLKTIQFYKDIQNNLNPSGIVVFNINPHNAIADDVKNIQDAFSQSYVFQLPNFGGLVVVASLSRQRVEPRALLARGVELDRRFKTSFSFRDMATKLIKLD